MVDANVGNVEKTEEERDLNGPACEDDGGQDSGNVDASAPGAQCQSNGPPEEAKEPRKWKGAVIFLCFYGFMASIKPGEPFITPNLLSSEKNFTREQVMDVLGLFGCDCAAAFGTFA